jgi:signal transduction histidine kinase/CHASE1-domain containing sensor protein
VLPLVVLLAGLVTTAFGSIAFLRTVRERDRARFANAVEATEDRVRGRVDAYLTLLRAGSGLIATDPQLRRAEFRAYVEGLELRTRYPGVQAIGFTVVVPNDGHSRVLDEMNALSDVRFELWPAGARDERTAIVWVEPFDARNRAALGYDQFVDPVRREALVRARDTGAPAVSGRTTLVQAPDAPKEAGVSLFLPVYSASAPPTSAEARRAGLVGWIFGSLRTDELFRGLFGSERTPLIAVSVFDGEALDEAHALHRSDTRGDDPTYLARFTRSTTLEVAGRRWTLQFRSRPAFEEAPSERMVALGALLGVALSLVLFGATRAQFDARRAAEAGEDRMRFLAEGSAALGDSLEPTEAAAALARAVVPMFVDLCVVDLAGEGGALVRAAFEHASAIPPEVAERLGRTPPDDERHPIRRAFALGKPLFEADFRRPERLGTTSADRLLAHAALAPRAAAAIPLVARGRTLGVVSFVRSTELDADDLALAVELVRRAALALDNARLYREAREAIRARDVFLSIASHELKTPLTSLKLHAQRLIRRAGSAELHTLPAEEIAERARSMDVQATRLNTLIDELLDVSRITAGRLRFLREPVDLTTLARDVVDRFGSPLASVSGDLNAVGEWDRMRLDQVVTNLVSNALKYGAGKPVAVRVEATETRARLVVEDHGLGIAKEHQDRIFERFERFVSERHFGGFGLGLWISRQIVEGLGGTITVQSEPGVGSTFVVDLPRNAAPQPDAQAEGDA